MDGDILADVRQYDGFTGMRATPVAGGWLNRKWKLVTDQGDWLVKQFSSQRYDRAKLLRVEAALQRQMALERQGVLCPHIRPLQGRAIRWTPEETAYMVMEYRPGWMEGPQTVTLRQLRSLGDACGRMHQAFDRLPAESVEGYPLDSGRQLNALWDNLTARKERCAPDDPPDYRRAVLAMEPMLRALTPAFFEALPKGIAHEDFSPDNMLFGQDGVTAILDFDRNHYSYVWHDIGRAMLSLALEGGRLRLERIEAFLEGYAQHRPGVSLRRMPDILRLTWCVETPWWIQPEYFRQKREKVARFRDEMLWLTERWFSLDTLFQA